MNKCSLQLWDHFPNFGCFFPQNLHPTNHSWSWIPMDPGMDFFYNPMDWGWDVSTINISILLQKGVWILSFSTLPTSTPSFKQPRTVQIRFPDSARTRLPLAGLEGGGETVLVSSYLPLITGFRRAEKGRMWSEAQQLLGNRKSVRSGGWNLQCGCSC